MVFSSNRLCLENDRSKSIDKRSAEINLILPTKMARSAFISMSINHLRCCLHDHQEREQKMSAKLAPICSKNFWTDRCLIPATARRQSRVVGKRCAFPISGQKSHENAFFQINTTLILVVIWCLISFRCCIRK